VNIDVLIILILIIVSFIVGYFFRKSKTKEKYENRRCLYCGHSEKENYMIK
jgi:hypothetical protein